MLFFSFLHASKNQKNVFEYEQDNLFKYAVGQFINDFKSANELKNSLREQGFESAFVIAFINDERVDLQKAINLASKNWIQLESI